MIPLEPSPVGVEALDDSSCPPELARTMLREIARANALFGGRAAARWGVRRLLDGIPAGRTLTLVDVGAGCGDIARVLIETARRRGIRLVAMAFDTHPEAAALARGNGLLPVRGDAAALPLRDAGIDILLASQFVHHFARDSAMALVRAFDRVARLGVVLCEPRRAPLAAAGIWVAGHALGFHPVTTRDGVLSVRRSFTRDELARLLRAAGIRATVARRPGFRLTAWWRSDHAHT